jgi:hypothetical protein
MRETMVQRRANLYASRSSQLVFWAPLFCSATTIYSAMAQGVARKPSSNADNAMQLDHKNARTASGDPVNVSTAPSTVLHDSGIDGSFSDTQGSMDKEASGSGIDSSITIESKKKRGKRKVDALQDDKELSSAVKYRKLAPPRPFPTVPTSVSATGPRSAHVQGKNYICVTRKAPLAMYLRRCKDVVLNDGQVTQSP